MLHPWLRVVMENAIAIIDTIAFLAIAYGTVEVVIKTVCAEWQSAPNHDKREIWLGYARWLIAGLTFQLAADIIETSLGTTWEAIGRLGAVAVIRTFLEFFLGRDVSEWRDRQRDKHGITG